MEADLGGFVRREGEGVRGDRVRSRGRVGTAAVADPATGRQGAGIGRLADERGRIDRQGLILAALTLEEGPVVDAEQTGPVGAGQHGGVFGLGLGEAATAFQQLGALIPQDQARQLGDRGLDRRERGVPVPARSGDGGLEIGTHRSVGGGKGRTVHQRQRAGAVAVAQPLDHRGEPTGPRQQVVLGDERGQADDRVDVAGKQVGEEAFGPQLRLLRGQSLAAGQ